MELQRRMHLRRCKGSLYKCIASMCVSRISAVQMPGIVTVRNLLLSAAQAGQCMEFVQVSCTAVVLLDWLADHGDVV